MERVDWYYTVREHPLGGYAVVECDEEVLGAPSAVDDDLQFFSLDEACQYAKVLGGNINPILHYELSRKFFTVPSWVVRTLVFVWWVLLGVGLMTLVFGTLAHFIAVCVGLLVIGTLVLSDKRHG